MKKKILCTLLSLTLALPVGTGMVLTEAPSVQAAASSKSPFTGSTYTHADAFDGMNIYHGIDVSYHNGTINWTKAKADGVEYAFLRAGYRGYGNGSLQEDPKFKTYAAEAAAAGIQLGVYYFTEATNEKEAIEEAESCLEIIKDYDITLPVALDYEYQYNAAGNLVSPKAGLSKAAATANSRAFCETISAAGYTPMIYANSSDLKTLINGTELSKDYMIWLANYTTKTSYSGAYDIWQYSSKGSVSGISGNTDCNFWYSKDNVLNTNFNSGDLKDATIAAIPAQTYTGKALKPAPTLSISKRTLKAGKDYTVTYSNNVKPGKATITITGKGNYTGTRTKTFTIKPKAVTSLAAKSADKKITLSWSGSTGGTGYEIWRTNTYNGTYKKVKTISKAATKKWANAKLGKDREYYYKIRSLAKVNGKTYYSAYQKISAGTTPGGKAAVTSISRKLLKKPSAKAAKLVTAPAGSTIIYVGRTVLADKKKFYHVQYKKGSKTYDGYLSSVSGLKLRKMRTTTTKVTLRSNAGTSSPKLTTVSKGQPIVILGSKKSGKTTWYKTSYLKGKKLYTGYLSGQYTI